LHIVKEKGTRQKSAKIWLKTLQVAERGTLNVKELTLALNLIKKYQTELIDSFNKVKSGHTSHLGQLGLGLG
jgi:hypothetical protein